MAPHESSHCTFSALDSLEARQQLYALSQSYPGSPEEKERSLGLFLRGSLFARLLAIDEIYQRIISLPGSILDLGTWRGQTAVLCENLRAIYEPLNFHRRIICFDTFTGYSGFSSQDQATPQHGNGTYSLHGSAYASLLSELLTLHERNNAMGHINGKHKVIPGDILDTLPQFLDSNSNELVALAFLDLNCFEPTRLAVEQILERLVPGGIIAFWQLTRDFIQAEGKVYCSHILDTVPHKLLRSKTYPGLSYLIKS